MPWDRLILRRCIVNNSLSASPTPSRSELWRQARGKAIHARFPKYTANLTETDDGATATLTVKYVDGRMQRLPVAGLTVLDILDAMAEFTEPLLLKEEMDELEKS